MTLEEKIEDILSTLEIPFAYEEYEGNEDTYAMYGIKFVDTTGFEDDTYTEETAFVVVSYWTSKRSRVKDFRKIEKAFVENGFEYRRFKGLKDGEYIGRLLEFNYNSEV